MLMETRKKMSVFLLSSVISSLVKMRDREMITPAVPEGEERKGGDEVRRRRERKSEKQMEMRMMAVM